MSPFFHLGWRGWVQEAPSDWGLSWALRQLLAPSGPHSGLSRLPRVSFAPLCNPRVPVESGAASVGRAHGNS